MVKGSYMRNILGNYLALLCFAIFVVGGLQFLILMLLSENVLELFFNFYKLLPPFAQQIFGEELKTQFTITGAAAFGYNHPLVLTVLMIVSILIPSRYISGEIESARMELLMALPIRRRTIIFTVLATMMFMLLCIVAGGWSGTFLAKLFDPEARKVPVWGVLRTGVNLWMLALCVSSYTLLISAFYREYGRASLLSAAITVGFFLVHYITKIWQEVDFLSHFNIVTYYSPQKVMESADAFYVNILILASLVILCSGVTLYRFTRRDIPG